MSETSLAQPAREQRLGEIHADRACIRCGFNLHGQPIVREPVYGLVMSRCPECAEVAALQDYPSLGRWAGRLAGAGALMWLVIVVAAGIGTGLAIFGLAQQTATDILHPGAMRLVEAYRVYAYEQAELIADPVQRQQSLQWFVQYTPEQWPMIDPAYVSTPGYAAALAGVAVGEHMDFSRARSLGWVALWSLVMGAAWAVLAPHLRRRGLAVVCAALVMVSAARWGLAIALGVPARAWGSYYWATDLVVDRYGAPLIPIGLATGGMFLFAGMLIGRPIARGLLRLLLPPRLRAPFGALWTLQGLDVPGARRNEPRA